MITISKTRHESCRRCMHIGGQPIVGAVKNRHQNKVRNSPLVCIHNKSWAFQLLEGWKRPGGPGLAVRAHRYQHTRRLCVGEEAQGNTQAVQRTWRTIWPKGMHCYFADTQHAHSAPHTHMWPTHTARQRTCEWKQRSETNDWPNYCLRWSVISLSMLIPLLLAPKTAQTFPRIEIHSCHIRIVNEIKQPRIGQRWWRIQSHTLPTQPK